MKKVFTLFTTILISSCATNSEWTVLFDGETVKGLRGYRQTEMPDSWEVVDGTLKTKPDHGIDLISEDIYKNLNGKSQLEAIVEFFTSQLKKEIIFGKPPLKCKY